VVQPATAPRFSRTPPAQPTPPQTASDPQALLDWGFGEGELAALRDQGLL
jgi:alpha-methylacyl-CoA racemase